MSNSAPTNKKELLAKLYAMVNHEGGNENEKQNAQRILANLLKKYKMTVDDFEPQNREVKTYKFDCKNQIEKSICVQCMRKVLKTNDFPIWKFPIPRTRKSKRQTYEKKTGTDCTYLEYVEIDMLFDFYKRLFKDEQKKTLECFRIAFMNKYDLTNNTGKGRILTEEELSRIYSLMNNLPDSSPRKQIESKTPPPSASGAEVGNPRRRAGGHRQKS